MLDDPTRKVVTSGARENEVIEIDGALLSALQIAIENLAARRNALLSNVGRETGATVDQRSMTWLRMSNPSEAGGRGGCGLKNLTPAGVASSGSKTPVATHFQAADTPSTETDAP